MGSSDYIAAWLHLFKCAVSLSEAQKQARSSYLKIDLVSTEYSICVLQSLKIRDCDFTYKDLPNVSFCVPIYKRWFIIFSGSSSEELLWQAGALGRTICDLGLIQAGNILGYLILRMEYHAKMRYILPQNIK